MPSQDQVITEPPLLTLMLTLTKNCWLRFKKLAPALIEHQLRIHFNSLLCQNIGLHMPQIGRTSRESFRMPQLSVVKLTPNNQRWSRRERQSLQTLTSAALKIPSQQRITLQHSNKLYKFNITNNKTTRTMPSNNWCMQTITIVTPVVPLLFLVRYYNNMNKVTLVMAM